jgi:pyrroloquinoline quinone biosynthesis protein B
MGHLPQTASAARAGMVDVMQATGAARKVLIHISNSNPILDECSAQRRALEAHGIEVSYDGMEITL